MRLTLTFVALLGFNWAEGRGGSFAILRDQT